MHTQIVDGMISSTDDGAGVPAGAIDCEGDTLHRVWLSCIRTIRTAFARAPGQLAKARRFLGMTELVGVGITTVLMPARLEADQKRKGYARYTQTADNILDLMRQRALKVSHHIHSRRAVHRHAG